MLFYKYSINNWLQITGGTAKLFIYVKCIYELYKNPKQSAVEN